MKKLVILMLAIAVILPQISEAKGGGGRGGGGARSSSASRSSSVSRTTTTKSPTVTRTATPKAPNITKPSATTKTVTSPTAKTVGGKTFSKKGNVVGEGYQPKFNGYVPGRGDTVYYRSSAWDWLPMYYIMTHGSHKEALVVTASTTSQASTEKVVKEEGKDGMYIFNWILTILLGLGIIGGIIYLFNKHQTNKYA